MEGALMSRILSLALVVTTAASCAGPGAGPLTEAERAAIADSVTAGMHAYEAAIKSLDAQRVLALYGDSSHFRLIDNDNTYSYNAVRTMVSQLFASLRSYEGGFGAIRVNALRRDVALADAPYTDVFTDTAGTVTRVRGLVTWVWLHGVDGWRIVHGQSYGVPETAPHR
jgi:ketosteroid isomerase-like protein